MTLRTTYFGGIGPVAEPDDEDLVLGVVRYPQDFINRVVDRNVPALAPPERLLDTYKAVEEAADRDDVEHPSAAAWNSVNFEDRYRDHLENTGQQQVIEEIRDRLRDYVTVWLVCWEKNPQYCHRRVLADVVSEDLGIEIDHRPAPDELHEDAGQEMRNANLLDFEGGSA